MTAIRLESVLTPTQAGRQLGLFSAQRAANCANWAAARIFFRVAARVDVSTPVLVWVRGRASQGCRAPCLLWQTRGHY